MADLGVTVELIPNFDKLESALSNYKEFPIQVDAAALQKSISSAIKNASSTKLKVNVDTANITAQIKKAISAAGTGTTGSGKAKSSAASTRSSTTKSSSSKSSPSGKTDAEKAAERQLRTMERQATGLRQTMSYLKNMPSPIDSKAISAAEAAMKKFESTTKGTVESVNALKEAQQATNIAFSRNNLKAAEKAERSMLDVQQIRSKFGQLKKGQILDEQSVKQLDSLLGKYEAEKDFTPAKYDLEKQIKSAWTTAYRKNSNAAIESAMAQGKNYINQMQALQAKGILKDYDWTAFKNAKDVFENAAAGTHELEQGLNGLRSAWADASAQAELFNAQQTATVRSQRSQEHLANIYRQASETLKNNPKAAGSYLQGELQNIMNRARNPGENDSVEGLQRDLAAVRSSMEELGFTSETAGQKLTRLFKDHFNTAIAMAGLHLLQNGLQQTLQNVIDVDTAMTDLKKVSEGSSQDYANYLDSAGERAKSLGASITDVIGATSEFSRLGFNLEDASNLGDWATKYMNVSEYTNIEDAAQSLVSTLQGFHLAADDVGSVVDRFNEVGNNYAISSEGLGEALKRSAAALYSGGNSLDESLGLVTAANEVVQDPDTVGTWAKTLSMYLRAAKADAEEAGIETDGMANSVSELRETIKTLTHDKVDIMSDEAGTKFKSTTQIMREIAGVYDSLSDVDQAALLKTISGKRMANTTSALIQNWSTVEDVIKSTQNAAGSADAENAKYLDSIQGKLAQFQAQFQSASTSVLDSGFVKGTIDAGSGILGFFNTLIDKAGVIPGLITPIASLFMSMNGKGLIGGKGEFGENTLDGSGLFSWLKNYNTKNRDYWQEQNEILKSYAQMKQKLSGADFEKALSGASIQSREFAKSLDTVGNAEDVVFSKIDNFTAKQEKIGTLGAKIASTFKGIGSAIASMAVSMAAVWAATQLIRIGADQIDKSFMTGAEAAEVTSENIENYTSSSKAIEENISTVEGLRDKFEELSKGVSSSGENISLTAEQFQEYNDIVSQLVAINPALVQGYNDENQAIIDKNNSIERTIELLKQQRVEEAKNAVYGGTSENDGGKTNAQVAFLASKDEYKKAKQNQQMVGNQIETFINNAFTQAVADKQGYKVKNILQKYLGNSYDDYLDQYGLTKGGMADYLNKNADAVHDNIAAIVSELNEAGVLTSNMSSEGSNLIQSWGLAGEQLKNSIGDLSNMIGMAFQTDEAYYDTLTEKQQSFLDNFADSIDSSILEGDLENSATDYATAMMKVAKYNDNAKKSMEDYANLIENRGSMTVSEYQEKAQKAMLSLKGTLRSELSKEELDAIDFRKMFGLEDLQKQTDDLKATITDNLADVKITDPGKMEEIVGLYQNWVDLHKEMSKLGVTSEEVNKATFGNLDLNDRSSVQWTKENLEKYKSEFLSWAPEKEKKKWENDTKAMGKYWQNFVKDMDGSVSTVLGSWGTFGKDEIPIAFTPLLDANGTLTPLSSDEVNSYINGIVGRAASMPGKLADNILKLDKAQYGIIADIGDTAERTADIMHFAGSDGALAQISSAIQEFCATNGYSTGEFFNAIQSGSEDAMKALAAMTMTAQDFNLDNLTGDQISTFDKIIATSGDNVSEYLGKLQAIDQAGHLGEFLDEFNKKLQAQSGAVRTVAQDLTDYKTALEKSTDNVETHENMVSIYDEFAKSVKKGQINTDTARAQMELLIGKVVDLKEAKKWISENQGFFLTGKDEDKVGQDLTGGFNTLHKKYNALSKDQKALVDGMMQVDWKNGSISVAANDVVDLARAFGMSTASLQQFFDLVDSYSNPTETNISTVSDTVDQLNQATIDAGKNIEPSLRASKAAWDSLTVAEKQALEAATKNTGIDPTQMTYNDIERLTDSYNALNAAMGKDFSTANVEKFFSGIGESVVTVEKLSDGTQSIDIKNVSAFVDKVKELSGLNISEGDLPTMLNLLNTKTRENGDPYKFTINGEAPITEEDTTQQMMDDLTEVFEHKYNLNIDTTEAEAKIDALIEKCKSFADGSYRTGATDTSDKSGGVKYSEPIGPEYQPKPIVFKTDTTQLDQAKQNLQDLQEAGIIDPEVDINVVTHMDENAQKFLAGQKLVDNSQSVSINATTHMDSPAQTIINGTLSPSIPVTVNASTNADQETQSLLNGTKQVGVQVSANVDTPNDPVTPAAQEMGKALDSAINKQRVVNVNTSAAISNVSSLAGLMNSVRSKTVTITVNKKTYETTTTGSSGPGKNKYTGGYTGFTGTMTGMASGGQSVGGKTLVGELGPEQWISRDGKHSKIVGKHGMEVIDTKRGDAIVPANITAGLIRGGLKQSYDGASSSGSLANLDYGTGGKYYNWKGTSSAKTKTQKVKVTADTSKLEDAAKEALDKIKEEVEDIIDQLEHKIYLLEEQHGDPYQIVTYYKQIMDEANKAANKFRAQGQKDSSEYIRNLQKEWWSAHDAIIDTMKDMYDKITSEHENAVKLAERSLDRLLDTDKLERSFTRAQRKIFNSAKLSQNILNGVAKKGNPLAGIFSGIADSFETKTVDTIFSSIDGDAIESTLNGIIDHYREAQKNLHKEAQYYRGMGYSDLSDEVADLSDQWWEYEDAVKDVKQKVIDYLSDIVDAASDSVDTVQDVLDTFKKAAEEYSTNGGFISVDTFQEISKLGVEYMGYLKDENGLLTINEEMINRVIKAKTDQMALESASAYVERLRMALQENDVVSLNNLLNATADLTEVQWGSVYAQLAMLDLTEEGYAQAVKNVDAYRSILSNVKSGVGIDFDDSKDSVDALFKYVEDMIRDEIDQQVDALEELKDKYSEIIDKKKESLQLSKDEADYQDEVADKVKEMAKLQEKINALSLDDSRESIAKRKDLEEQLADLQKELGETQANEAYDRQTDNLDKMQEAYEKEKDAEIKKLQDSISSEEKLYQMARKRIQDGWESLYSDLMKWNTEYGSDLNSQLQSAWDNATKAMEKYKLSYLELYDKLGDSGSNSSSSGSNSTTLGDSNKYGAGSQTEAITGIVQQMYDNSQAWHKASPDEKNNLKKANSKLADKLKGNPYNLDISYDPHTGVWSFSDGTSLYKKYLGKLHTGGVVGDFSTLRQDEMIATLQKGEIVLDKPKQQSLDSILKVMSAITSGLSASALPDLSKTAQMPVSGVNREVVTIPRENVTNVTFGDTIIKGADGDTVKQHEAVSRRMVNDIIEVLKIKK